LNKKAKITAVERKLDGETPDQRYWRRREEEWQPLKDELEKQIDEKRREIEDELEAAQKTCKHVDDGGMFYGSCKLCGLMFDA
jgi:hypothetical protein